MNQFDASRVFDHEPISPTVSAEHQNRIQYWRGDVSALGILLNQSKRQLQEAVYSANFAVWGHWDADAPAPTREEAADLLKTHGNKFENKARDAHNLRALCKSVSAAIDAANVTATEGMNERGRKDQEADDMAAFEAHEAREKHRRFEAWRANR